MTLTDADVARFRDIYKKAYGEEMPIGEARVWAIQLVRLYRILLRPTPSDVARRERLAKSSEPAIVKTPTPPLVGRADHPPPAT